MKLDKKTIKKIQKRDRRSELELYKKCFQYWMRVAMKYFTNESEAAHCVNDSFIKMCDSIDRYNNEFSFITWSRTIVTRTVLDELRKTKKYKESILITDEIENLETGNEELQEDIVIDKEQIVAAMDKLPNATKNVVKMYLLEGHNHEDISEVLNISTETSKWHLKTGKKKLKELLPKYNNQ